MGGFYCKYKYHLLIFIVGFFLMLIGGTSQNKKIVNNEFIIQEELEFDVSEVEKMMESLFKKIEGVGDVEVRITLKSGYEKVYAYNIDQNISTSQSASSSSIEKQLILISENGEQKPITLKVNQPQFCGAVIVCEGGDNSKIKYELTQATKSLTGISANNIIVVKMK